jgi:hypothetical protein
VAFLFLHITFVFSGQHAVQVIVARVMGQWWEHGGHGEEEDDVFSLAEEKRTESDTRKSDSELWQAVCHMMNLRMFAAVCHGSLLVFWVNCVRQILDQCHDNNAVKHLEDNAFIKSPQREQDLIDEEELRCSKQDLLLRNDKGAEKLKHNWFFGRPWCGCVWPTESKSDQLTLPLWARVHQDWNHSYNQWGFVFLGLYDNLKWSDAATNADEQLHIRGWSTIANDDLIRNVLGLVSLVIGGCTGCFGLMLVECFVAHDPLDNGAISTTMTNTHHIAFM